MAALQVRVSLWCDPLLPALLVCSCLSRICELCVRRCLPRELRRCLTASRCWWSPLRCCQASCDDVASRCLNVCVPSSRTRTVQAQIGHDDSGEEDLSALADIQQKLLKNKWGNKLTDFGEFVEVRSSVSIFPWFRRKCCAAVWYLRLSHVACLRVDAVLPCVAARNDALS